MKFLSCLQGACLKLVFLNYPKDRGPEHSHPMLMKVVCCPILRDNRKYNQIKSLDESHDKGDILLP